VWLLLALCPAWAAAQSLAAIPALDSPVVDTTGTLDAAQKQQQALDLQKRKGSQLQVLVVASTQPETIEEYTSAPSTSGSWGARAWTTACCWWSPRTIGACASSPATGWKARSPMPSPTG
jgi:hypothetical protein